MREILHEYMGEPIAILCARYWYRGILSKLGDSYLVLSQPFAVEVTGLATAEETSEEDRIPSDLIISFGAVEIVCQPTWVSHGLDIPE